MCLQTLLRMCLVHVSTDALAHVSCACALETDTTDACHVHVLETHDSTHALRTTCTQLI
jgi:hypothetical protein